MSRLADRLSGQPAGAMVPRLFRLADRRQDTADAGDAVGWSWLVPPYLWLFDARAVEPVGAVCFDGVCLRDRCEQDPRLGYELMKLVSQVMLSRLTAARVRLLDLYGDSQGGGASPLLDPLLREARATWARPATARPDSEGVGDVAPG